MENNPIRRRTKEPPSWSDMQTDILLQIFALVSVMDRILNVAVVCRSWRTACSNKILSSTLDTCEIRKQMDPDAIVGRSRLEHIFLRGLNVGGEYLTTLVIDPILHVHDKHLIYAAKRCSNLQHLGLPSPYGTTYDGLRKAFRFWKQLESLYISFFSHLPHINIFKIIGKYCPIFTHLKICACYVDKETAEVAIKPLPRLKVLSVRSAMVTQDAADAILDNLKNLDELYISISKLEFVAPVDRVFLPAIIYEPRVLRKASRLRVYHVCYKRECSSCPASTLGPPPSDIF